MTIKEIGLKTDKIIITQKEFKKISKWATERNLSEDMDKRLFFPLKTFVIEMALDKHTTLTALVELDSFNPVNGKITTDNYWFTYKREKEKRRAHIEGEGAPQNVMQPTHVFIVGAMLYICLKSREHIERISTESERKETEKDNPYKYQDRVCFLLNDIIHYTAKHPNRKSIQYQCECWGVRGHIRHYTDGRVVFIEPYKKGRLRNTLEPKSKTYLLTSDIGDYPDTIPNQFDNMTGSMNL